MPKYRVMIHRHTTLYAEVEAETPQAAMDVIDTELETSAWDMSLFPDENALIYDEVVSAKEINDSVKEAE